MTSSIDKLSDQLFRNTSGKLVAVLTKIFGTENLEIVEDVVQQTFIDALQTWKLKGVPENPPGWLFRVAKNKAIDVIRRNKHSIRFDFSDHEKLLLTSEYTLNNAMNNLWKEELVEDDFLRMMFACCHSGISNENQIILILKTLCGFSTIEIARAFLSPEDTISKKLYRTREFFRENKIKLVIPSVSELKGRTDAVLNTIYLIFNEGYNSTHAPELIRKDLIEEAMLLCKLVTDNPHTRLPEANALMALMCFHAARMPGRLNDSGDIILLSMQDRKKWDRNMTRLGNSYMSKAAIGNTISTYHLEAAISYEHSVAPDFDSTNWSRILELYEWLLKMAPSPITEMNRAVAILQVHGPHKALDSLNKISGNHKLDQYYLFHSLLGEIYKQLGMTIEAGKHLEQAVQLTKSITEQKMLKDKIASLFN